MEQTIQQWNVVPLGVLQLGPVLTLYSIVNRRKETWFLLFALPAASYSAVQVHSPSMLLWHSESWFYQWAREMWTHLVVLLAEVEASSTELMSLPVVCPHFWGWNSKQMMISCKCGFIQRFPCILRKQSKKSGAYCLKHMGAAARCAIYSVKESKWVSYLVISAFLPSLIL